MAVLAKDGNLEQIAETEVKIGVQMFHKLVEMEMLKEDDRKMGECTKCLR
ncbi:MAG: hypothetical protein E3K37_13715 [Candidatus Kuenenia sp.]|nr:hypothetical protein [Candidatus Kuenenia hertensis]